MFLSKNYYVCLWWGRKDLLQFLSSLSVDLFTEEPVKWLLGYKPTQKVLADCVQSPLRFLSKNHPESIYPAAPLSWLSYFGTPKPSRKPSGGHGSSLHSSIASWSLLLKTPPKVRTASQCQAWRIGITRSSIRGWDDVNLGTRVAQPRELNYRESLEPQQRVQGKSTQPAVNLMLSQ